MLDEQDFRRNSDQALEHLNQALIKAGERYPLETDFNAGALTVEFEDPPARFVVSPNTPVRQIWVSAQSKSYKLDWDETAGSFVLPETGETLIDLLASRASDQLGESVIL